MEGCIEQDKFYSISVMSKTFLSRAVKSELWFKAHGRCEMCNKPLYRDGLTMMGVNLSEYAHIIADSVNGPRGDEILSSEYCDKESNLILLCKDHHKLIDSAEGAKKYDVALLKKIKQEHEARIELVTGISPEKKSMVVCYAPIIGDRTPSITDSITMETLFPDMFPMELKPIRLNATDIPFNDNQQKYWEVQPDILKENFRKKLAEKIADIPHISLFALAPQPLLVLLGTLIGDLYHVDIMQKHRDPDTWRWLDENVDNEFRTYYPENKGLNPVLIIALSGCDIIERVKQQLGDGFSYWVITCENPYRDMMRTRHQLSDFGTLLKKVLCEINANSVGKMLQVFPAMPVSCAIKMGQVRLPKADLPWVLYDLPKESEVFVKTITIE